MHQKSLIRASGGGEGLFRADQPKPDRTFFDYMFYPLGSSFIFIAIIGSPRQIFKMAKLSYGLTQHFKTKYLNSFYPKKIGAGTTAKSLLIPFLCTGIECILHATSVFDDDLNILSEGTLTGSAQTLATGGLYGLLLSSMYCEWREEEK